MKTKLSQSAVNKLQAPTAGQAFYWDEGLPGFGVRITNTGAKSYIVQGRVNGKDTRFTLGSCKLLSYQQALNEARDKLQGVRKGVAPNAKPPQTQTLSQVVSEYLSKRKLKDSTKKDINRAFATTFEPWLTYPITDINVPKCIELYEAKAQTAPQRIQLDFAYLRGVINWYRVRNMTNEGEYTVFSANPVSTMFTKGAVDREKQKARSGYIPANLLPKVWSALTELQTPASRMLQFMLLTGCRVGEAKKLQFAEVHLNELHPRLVFRDTKTGNDFTVHIGGELVKLLTTVLQGEQFVGCKCNTPIFGNIDTRNALKHVGQIVGTHITNHDLRRTFAQVAGELKIDPNVRRFLLNHTAQDVHDRHYENAVSVSILRDAGIAVGNAVVHGVKGNNTVVSIKDSIGVAV